MVNFPTCVPDCDSHSPALLDLFLSSDASICSIMTFPPLGNSDHVVVSVSIAFPINSKRDIIAEGFLTLPNLHMLLKQKNPSLLKNLALGTFSKLLTVFSTKVDLLYLLYSTAWSFS